MLGLYKIIMPKLMKMYVYLINNAKDFHNDKSIYMYNSFSDPHHSYYIKKVAVHKG